MRRFLFLALASLCCVVDIFGAGEEIAWRFDTFTMKVNGELVLVDPTFQSLRDLKDVYTPSVLAVKIPGGKANSGLGALVQDAVRGLGRYDADSINNIKLFVQTAGGQKRAIAYHEMWGFVERSPEEFLVAEFGASESEIGLQFRMDRLEADIRVIRGLMQKNQKILNNPEHQAALKEIRAQLEQPGDGAIAMDEGLLEVLKNNHHLLKSLEILEAYKNNLQWQFNKKVFCRHIWGVYGATFGPVVRLLAQHWVTVLGMLPVLLYAIFEYEGEAPKRIRF